MANSSVIPEDYGSLKNEYLNLTKELDKVHQELYDCKRQIKVQQAVEHEYQSEIDMLQSEEIHQKKKYQETISQLEETISSMRVEYGERIHKLETDLENMEEKNEALEAELDMVRKTNTSMTFSGDTTKLIEEILSLKEDHEGISENQDALVANMEELQYTNAALEKALNEMKEETSNLRESLECKREELLEANTLIQKLNDDIVCMKTELDSFKSQPLDEKSKGNSLFAEVDDRRVYLQQTMNEMRADYVAMKQERSQYINTIHQLKLENMRLLDKWKTDSSEKEDDENEVLKSVQYRVKVLEDLIEKYKKDLEAKPVVISKNNYEEIQYYQVVLNNKNKEIDKLREQLSSRSLTQILLSTSLKEANEEKRKWRLDAISKQNELDRKTSENSQTSEETNKLVNEIKQSQSTSLDRRSANVTRRNTNERLMSLTNDKKELRKTTDTNNLMKKADDRQLHNLRRSERDDRTNTEFGHADFIKKYNVNVKSMDTVNLEESSGVEVVENLEEAHCERLAKNKEPTEERNRSDCIGNNVLREIKENVPDNLDPVGSHLKTEQSRKVTFSENTISPKLTSRSGYRTCKRIIVAKPVYFPSNPNS